VDPIYSSKKVANQKLCVGGVPVELNLFAPFRIEKAQFSEKKSSRPQTNFHCGKKGRFGGFDNQRIKFDSQNPKDKTWPKILLHSVIDRVCWFKANDTALK